MPILVQWKWKEQKKDFVVIFHFFDDYSKPNLRLKKKTFAGSKSIYVCVSPPLKPKTSPYSRILTQTRTVMTWAPSHLELAMLSEILSYANIIDGLKEAEKRKLRNRMEFVFDIEGELYFGTSYEELLNKLCHKDKILVVSHEENKTKDTFSTCFQVCPEYINYLRKVLEPYLK